MSSDPTPVLIIIFLLLLVVGGILYFVANKQPATPKPVTVLVCGAAGVGKSTLINAYVGGQIAAVGIGQPVTQNTTRIISPAGDFVFYDSKGLEVEDASQTYLLLMSDLLRLRFSPEPREQIDLALMCISEGQQRIDDAHFEIAALCEDLRIPLGIALTKKEDDPRFESAVRAAFPHIAFVRRVRALELHIGSVVIPREGVPELYAAMHSIRRSERDESRARARIGRGSQSLSGIARSQAARTESNAAWIQFAHSAWTCLNMRKPKWDGLIGDLRSEVKKTFVPNFVKRHLATKFDKDVIDGAIAKRLLPYIMRRFSRAERILTAADLNQVCKEAVRTLEAREALPFRSRF